MVARKKILAILLAAAMATATVPYGAAAKVHAEGEDSPAQESSEQQTIDNILNPGDPDGYSEDDTSNPMGYQKDVPVQYFEDAEFFNYVTDPGSKTKSSIIYDKYNDDASTPFLEKDRWVSAEDLKISSESTYTGDISSHWFVDAVPMNIGNNETGRRNCVAFIGAKKLTGVYDVDVWIYDTLSKKFSNIVKIGEINGIGIDDSNNQTMQYQMRNFITITSGDYNGDGKDTIVAYAAFTTGPALVELKAEGDGKSAPTVTKMDSSSDMLHEAYMQNREAINVNDSAVDGRYKLGCSLASGDINGDKTDDLAVLSYTQNLSDGNVNKYGDNIVLSELAVSLGGKNKAGKNLLSDTSKKTYVAGDYQNMKGKFPPGQEEKERLTVASPTVTITKIDYPDDYRLVIGGYRKTIQRFISDNAFNMCETDLDKASVFEYRLDDDKLVRDKADGDSVEVSKALRQFNGDSKTFPKLPVESVSFNGNISPDWVFIGGSFYDVSGNAISKEYEVPCFDNEYTKEIGDAWKSGYELETVFVDDMSSQSLSMVGCNYNALAFSMVFIYKKGNSYKNYYRAGVSGPIVDSDAGVVDLKYGSVVGAIQSSYINDTRGVLDGVDYNVTNSDFGINYVMCPVDSSDDDGVSVRFSQKHYIYADPKILAVLQAAPYFGELGKRYGETEYEFGWEYNYTNEDSDTFSFSAAFEGSFDFEYVEASFAAGAKEDIKTWNAKEKTTGFTRSFTAEEHDVVIIYRLPIVYYSYDLWNNETKQWEEGAVAFSYVKPARYETLSVNAYNSFVDQYNNEFKKKGLKEGEYTALKKLEGNIYLGCEGDPTLYYQGKEAPNGYFEMDKSNMSLSYAGGKSSTKLIKSEGKEHGRELSEGCTFELEFKAGTPFAKAGIKESIESMSGHSVASTNTEETGIMNTVANIDEDELLEKGYTQKQVEANKFTWRPAMWDSGLQYEYKNEDGEKVVERNIPIYGYGLGGVEKSINFDKATITLKQDTFERTGEPIVPSITVKVNGKTVQSGEYKVSYMCDNKVVDKCIEPNTYLVIVENADKGKNIGKTSAQFKIVEKPKTDIKDAVVTLEPDSFEFDGNPKKPNATVKLGDKTLVEGTDYVLEYAEPGGFVDECVNPGIYTVIADAIGNDYTGSATARFEIKEPPLDFSTAEVTLDSDSFEYDGKAKYPANITVKINDVNVDRDDYTVTYKCGDKDIDKNACIDADTYTVVIKGQGNNTGEKTAQFTIKPADFAAATIALDKNEFEYDGTAKAPKATVKLGDKTLVEGTDYELKFSESESIVPGTYTVTAEGKGNYSGTATSSAQYTIKPADLKAATITIDPSSFDYDKSAKVPAVIVTLGGKTLTKDTDYTLTYSYSATEDVPTEFIEPGTYTVTASGKGNYSGTNSATFTIKRTHLTNATISVTPKEFDWDGNKKEPEVTIKLGENTLVNGTDYDLTYSKSGTEVTECTDAETYVITAVGKGDFVGRISETFKIKPADISNAELKLNKQEFEYTGTAVKPVASLTLGDTILVEGKDYKLLYSQPGGFLDECVEQGTYEVVAEGMGNYTGTVVSEFTIKYIDVKNAEIKINPAAFEYDGTAKTPKVVVTLGDAILVEGTDYDMTITQPGSTSLKECVKPGTYTVVIEGKGIYGGSKEGTFKINDPIDLKDAKVVLSATDFTYNGKVQKPTITSIAGKTLKEGTDYKAEWSNSSSTEVGTYTISITGIGKYAGTTKATYKIVAKAGTPTVALDKTSYVYDGTEKTPVVTVKDGSTELKKDTDYTVTYDAGRTNVGTYKVTVTLKGNYSGTVSQSFTITKAANTLSVKAKKVTLKYSKVKKKTQTLKVTKAINFKNKGQGKVTYKLKSVSKSKFKKYFKVNAKTGKITVKKGLKKGTYKLKIKVKAAGNGNYKASKEKTITVKIKVK